MQPLKRFDHVSVAVPKIEEGYALFRDVLGAKVITPKVMGSDERFSWSELELAGLKLELIQPEGRDSFVRRFLDGGGSKVHHLTFEVQDLERAVVELEGRGLRLLGRDADDPDWKIAFIHPKSANGVLIQLFERKK
jgi:methylmalonyl-CoA/ethylmalonyl-CoA epimerase